MVEALALLRRYWPFLAIAGLVMALLYMRGDIASLKAAKDRAEAKAATLESVNKTNARVIEGFTQQRIANDAIIQQLTGVKTANAERETTVRTIIEKEARNDPVVRDWLNQPVPSGVRRAVNTPGN
ncbi:hypothetical protein P9A30_gp60 [Sphingomonas phage Lucius]|uniref:Uncharacterized protein n=1 Tax=Sphingomonas phage Lucius TaxID=2686313 RepID=A0A6M3TC43_9CAUD|nr:hypothetical protein P9A30_gp60 [Sphingomonas phage Lucius]QJD54502.1 hypothetical protein [Sphingomonas phage Lucius]